MSHRDPVRDSGKREETFHPLSPFMLRSLLWLAWQPGSGWSLEEEIIQNFKFGTHWWYGVLRNIPVNEGLI